MKSKIYHNTRENQELYDSSFSTLFKLKNTPSDINTIRENLTMNLSSRRSSIAVKMDLTNCFTSIPFTELKKTLSSIADITGLQLPGLIKTCLVKENNKYILPIGYSTSSLICDITLTRVIDECLQTLVRGDSQICDVKKDDGFYSLYNSSGQLVISFTRYVDDFLFTITTTQIHQDNDLSMSLVSSILSKNLFYISDYISDCIFNFPTWMSFNSKKTEMIQFKDNLLRFELQYDEYEEHMEDDRFELVVDNDDPSCKYLLFMSNNEDMMITNNPAGLKYLQYYISTDKKITILNKEKRRKFVSASLTFARTYASAIFTFMYLTGNIKKELKVYTTQSYFDIEIKDLKETLGDANCARVLWATFNNIFTIGRYTDYHVYTFMDTKTLRLKSNNFLFALYNIELLDMINKYLYGTTVTDRPSLSSLIKSGSGIPTLINNLINYNGDEKTIIEKTDVEQSCEF